MKVKKIVLSILLILLLISITTSCFALDIGSVKTKMNGVQDLDGSVDQNTGVGKVLNIGIGLIQIAGTGIALITITILGARYMLSAPEQKAEIKNRAMPVVIGMIILFGSVNIIGILATIVNTSFGDNG